MKKIILLLLAVLFILPVANANPSIEGEEKQIIQASQKILDATVKIIQGTYHGTGFYVDKHSILTNSHVLNNNNKPITIESHSGTRCTAKVQYKESQADLALLTTDCEGKALPLNQQHFLGQTVLVMGHPQYYDFTLSKGILSSILPSYLQLDAKVNFGSSGGPVTDIQGWVIGVLTLKANSSDYVSFAIPSSKVALFIERAQRFTN